MKTERRLPVWTLLVYDLRGERRDGKSRRRDEWLLSTGSTGACQGVLDTNNKDNYWKILSATRKCSLDGRRVYNSKLCIYLRPVERRRVG